MAMKGRTDWLAANDGPKASVETSTREWTRARGETWYRRTPAAAPEARPQHPLVTASRVSGSAVYSGSGRRLGRVVEIALDEVTGDIAFVVVASGGFLGFGDPVGR